MDSLTFLLVVSAAIMHATWNFFTKKTKGDRVTMLWLGKISVGLTTLPITFYFTDTINLSAEFFIFIILSGIIHGFYIYLLGWSYKVGEVSTVYPISRGTGIAGTSVIAILFGVDDLSLRGIIGILVLIIGILCISIHKSINRNEVLVSSFLVGISISLYSITDKLAVQVIPSVLYASLMFLSTAFFLSPFIFYKFKAQLSITLKKYKLQGTIICAAMFTTYNIILVAFQNAPASYVVALREVSIVVAAMLGILFLKERVTKNKLYGTALVLAGAAIIKFA